MAYRFDYNRFFDTASLREQDFQSFDFELSVSTDTPHVASCACEACDNNGNEDQDGVYGDIASYLGTAYVSPWPDFGAISGGDHDRHDHDTKEITGDVLAGSVDTIPGDSSTTFTIAVGGEASGVRNSSTDQDWFQVDLVNGQQYVFIMLREEIDGVAGHEDPELFLFAPDGTTQLATNDDFGGRNARITYTATEDGTFYIAADGWDTTTGGYTIYVEESDQRPDFNNDEIAYFLSHQFDNFSAWDVNTTITYNVTGLEAGGQTLAHLAFDAWAEVSGLSFQSVISGGMITFDDEQSGAFASTSGPTGVITSSTINVDKNWTTDSDGNPVYDVNSYRYQTYLHEIGHALGLGHGGTYNGSATYGIDNVYNQDSWSTTVMSYFDQGEAGSGTPRLVLGLQVADLLAIQNVYGTNASGTRTGDTVYGANATDAGSIYDFDAWEAQGIRPPSFSIYDTDGIDTFDLSIYAEDQTISLVEETFSSVGDNGAAALSNVISIGRGAVIENAIGGSGNDTITGNDASNELEGNAGNDILDGGAGTDYAVYNGAQASYTITDNGDGTWTITGEGNDTLSNVEFARFTDGDVALNSGAINGTPGDDNPLDGTSGADIINGLDGNDTINGLAGDDIINGGNGMDVIDAGADNDTIIIGGIGADIIDGGAGFDTATYDNSGLPGSFTYFATASPTFSLNILRFDGTVLVTDIVTNVERFEQSSSGVLEILALQLDGTDNVLNLATETMTSQAVIFAGGGNDVITAGSAYDGTAGTLGTTDYANILYGGTGLDSLTGSIYSDILEGGADADTLDGGTGAGIDVLGYYSSNAGVTVDLSTNTVSGGHADGDMVSNFESVDGSSFGDMLTGDGLANALDGREGDDTLDGGAGDDTLIGGDGTNTLTGGTGNDTFLFQTNDSLSGLPVTFNDVITDIEATDIIKFESLSSLTVPTFIGTSAFGNVVNQVRYEITGGQTLIELDSDGDGVADSTVTLNGEFDIAETANTPLDISLTATAVPVGPINGTSGDDNPLNGTSGDDVINGLAGDDFIYGLEGNDVINGGDGRDVLRGGDGDDILNGDAGNDDFRGGDGADTFNGGAGRDRVFYSDATAGITANFIDQSLNAGEAAGDSYNSIEGIYGSNFDDEITSGNDNNDLFGLGGNDVLIGAAGRDRLYGGTGDDRLLGGRGNDDMNGGTGSDTFVIRAGAGVDRIFTYEVGVDVIEYTGGPGDMADLTIEQVGNNTRITSIVGILTLIGITATDITAADFNFINPLPDPTGVDVFDTLTAGNDVFDGDENDNIVEGLGGDDTLRGGIGDDELIGGDGNDLLSGGLGADVLNGGAGTDRVLYSTASTGVTINVLNPSLNTGEAAGDTYISIESFSGSNGDDDITSGNDGNRLIGLAGDDILRGTGGDDTLFGGADDDRLIGGTDNDVLYGGTGADIFVFSTNAGDDIIRDFEDGVDIIEFRGLVDDFTDLTITQDGNDAIITSANGVITLTDFNSTLLDAADFTFI